MENTELDLCQISAIELLLENRIKSEIKEIETYPDFVESVKFFTDSVNYDKAILKKLRYLKDRALDTQNIGGR